MPPVVGPSVKALVNQWEGKEGKAPCKFWGTEQGCRRGERCTFGHERGSLEKHFRCFACSPTAHRKKDCPTLKSQSEGSKAEKDKKISKLKDSPKGKSSAEKKGSSPAQESAKKPEPEAAKEKAAVGEVQNPQKPTGESNPVLVQDLTGLVKSLSTTKPLYVKSVQADGESGI